MKSWVAFSGGFSLCGMLVAYMLHSESLFIVTALCLAMDLYYWNKLGA